MNEEKEKTYISTNLKYLRNSNNKSLNDVANICDKTDVAVHYWENGSREPNAVDIAKLSNYFNVSVDDLLLKDLRFDNGTLIDMNSDTVLIPVLGTIKAGIPIEAQEYILEYVDIPKSWLKGNKSFYGLKISGDSMYPKYSENDIVIFEKNGDYELANRKDCAVMVNGFDATFKNVTISDSGITLTPFNLNNTDNYLPTFYNKEQIEKLPVKIIGIAREKRTRL